MKYLNTLPALALATGALTTSAQAVEIEVGYAYSALFDVTMERMMPEFKKAHPDIDVKFRATYENYEDGTNTILRESVAGDLPDVTFQGLNRQAMLVEKGIAKSLEPFIAAEADFAKDGYHEAMLELGTFNGEVYGLPYSVSLPVGYTTWMPCVKPASQSCPQHGMKLLKIAISSWKPAIKHQCGGVGA